MLTFINPPKASFHTVKLLVKRRSTDRIFFSIFGDIFITRYHVFFYEQYYFNDGFLRSRHSINIFICYQIIHSKTINGDI